MSVGFELLDTITTALYEDPIVIFREYVQNSLDCQNRSSKKITVKIDIDKDTKSITIVDNGPGIPSPEFLQTMLDISRSKKTTADIGFRGIGRLSALPFCEKLMFESKSPGESHANLFVWDGRKYREILSSRTQLTLDEGIKQITSKNLDLVPSLPGDSYFKVSICSYGYEIEKIVANSDLRRRLAERLPVDYSDKFQSAKAIKSNYYDLFGEPFDKYVCKVFLNGKELSKNYTDELVGDSKIYFKIFKIPDESDNMTPVAILWYSFNRKIEANKDWKKYYVDGICIRSKNMAMGNRKSLALYALRNTSRTKLTTERELRSVLDGLSGELLIKTDILEDNSKREWFKPSRFLDYFMNSITDFMMNGHKCRYCISRYYRTQDDNLYEEMVDSLKTFTDSEKYAEKIQEFIKQEFESKALADDEESSNEKKVENEAELDYFADHDMPTEKQEIKASYDHIMTLVKEFMNDNGYKELFEQMRAYIRRKLRKTED